MNKKIKNNLFIIGLLYVALFSFVIWANIALSKITAKFNANTERINKKYGIHQDNESSDISRD